MGITVDIEKTFGDFDMKIQFDTENRRIGILGASGSGKSMTLKTLAGIVTPDKGLIKIGDRVLFDSANRINIKTRERRIGYLFQNYALFPTMTVEENIASGLRGNRQAKRDRVSLMIENFALTGLEKRYPGELSGGQMQRVALARIMAYAPDVILLDEPFSALDVFLKDRLQQELFDALSDYPGTCILVSHDRDEIYRFSDKLLIIDKGRVVSSGQTKTLFENPGNLSAARLTGCKNFAAIEVLSPTQIHIPAWNVTLFLKRPVPAGVTAIGYRAHDFVPVWDAPSPEMIPFHLASLSELQFERKYYLTPESGDPICFFVHREHWPDIDTKGLPSALRMVEEKIMFLG